MEFIQVFILIAIAIGTLLYMCCRSLTFSSSSSSSSSTAADSTAVADDDDADSPPRREKYDVFISFRGQDTRNTFTSHLHAALLQKNIETYIDNRLQRGEEIIPAVLEAIEKSTVWVIIFSQNYASSTWCLDEIVHILKCYGRGGGYVIPIFYHTNPSDVRKQGGSYAVAFAQHQKRFKDSIDKVHEWRKALWNATNFSGFDCYYGRTEADLIEAVVNHICTRLSFESSCVLQGLVGIESRIEQIEELLDIHSPDACITTVGIWGMGGVGKTTLAETVFHKLSSKFEASCFLRNVREYSEQGHGLYHLEETLLKEMFKEEVLPSTFIRKRLSRTKVLIVLDDVSSSMQVEQLVGDRFNYGSGSRIIITSRDRGALRNTVEDDKIYKVEGLKPDDALQLFCSRAFKNTRIHLGLAEKAMHYAGGIPLALIHLGSSFLSCKSKEDMEDELDKLKQFPNENIQRVLRLSYDRLDSNEKGIFLDIACFHIGENVKKVEQLLDIRRFYTVVGISILIDMSLISIGSKWGRETIEMHNLFEEMGRTIVQEQSIGNPSNWSRLFNDKDVYHVLKSNTETPKVEAIRVNWSKIEERPLKCADFKKMSNLTMLIVDAGYKFNASLDLPDSLLYLYWEGYPLESLPSNFCPEDLVELHMPYSKVKKLWKEEQRLVNLQVIDLHDSTNLTEVPNLYASLKIVNINLSGCESLVEIPEGLVCSTSLEFLDLSGTKIRSIPASIKQASRLSKLNIVNCKWLQSLPELPLQCNVEAEGCTALKAARR
nr:putative disease resistance protein At4g11170 [Malus domestica]